MQKFLSKYAVAAHLALLAVSPLFLFPYFQAGVVAEVILWLSLFALAWVFMEPSRHSGEMLHDARARVATAVVRDPLFWVMAILSVLAALRWINNGVEMAFDTENMRWHLSEPLFVAIPSAAGLRGKLEFATTLAAWIILMGIRHSLGKQARLSFLFSSAIFAGIAAVIAISLASFGNPVAVARAKVLFTNPVFIGPVFAIYAMSAIVSLAGSIEAKWNRIGWIPPLAIGGTFAGAFVFSPSFAILIYAAVAILTAFICMGWLGSVSRGANAMRFFAILFIGVVLAILIVTCVAPDDIVAARIAEIRSIQLFPKDYPEIRAVLAKASQRAWEGAKWLGSGLGTFILQIRFVLDKEDWTVIHYARPCAYSAWWTLVAERGLIGAISLAIPYGFLFFTLFRRIPGVFGNRFFLPGCWLGFSVLAVAISESFFDASFLRPEALLAVVVFVAISSYSLPPPRRRANVDDGGGED